MTAPVLGSARSIWPCAGLRNQGRFSSKWASAQTKKIQRGVTALPGRVPGSFGDPALYLDEGSPATAIAPAVTSAPSPAATHHNGGNGDVTWSITIPRIPVRSRRDDASAQRHERERRDCQTSHVANPSSSNHDKWGLDAA